MLHLSTAVLIAFLVLLGRGIWWIVNLLIISPIFDPLKKLPGPDASFFTSHIGQVTDPDFSATLHEEWRNTHGKTFRYHGAGKYDYRLMSFDFRVVAHVLTSSLYEKPWQTRSFVSSLLGRGVFTMEGAEHDLQRKIIGPAFTTQSVKNLSSVFFQKAEELRFKWDEMLSQDSSSSIDVSHWTSRATFDAFGLACLDYNFGALHGETEDVYVAYRRMFDMADKKSLLRILLPSLDKIWPDDVTRTVQESLRVICGVGQTLVSEKKAAMREEKSGLGDIREKDLLSLLIKSNLSSDPSKRLSDSVLLDQITSFLFAGSDSTALALSWCLHLLALHPDIQSRLRAELTTPPIVDSGYAESFQVENQAFDALDSYPLLDAVVRETLRLVPPVHGTLRVATKDDLIPVSHPVVLRDGTVVQPGGHIQIRKGSFIHIPIEGLNFSREIWGADSLEFRPERWSSLPPNAHSPAFPGLANVMTFSFGPHSCPGFKFTITEMKAFLAALLPHFTFAPVEGQKIGKCNGVFTRPFIKGRLREGLQLPLVIKRYEEST